MNTITRRITAGAAQLAAPARIALVTATSSCADPGSHDNGPLITQPVEHPAFPIQTNVPTPGGVEHHHHQWNHS